ncbi:NAD(P)/FAD-dependent oxidoreductase [Hymenobacter sp. 15J16-1T3B]|uniref:NAD(P)/FAD-dependent oxidoreductase n=1 Tax=Hymenobacter sp. 15J16-1T3B TaxID=2886941 RepID=UPI001D10B5C7|nr:FAD-dependent oxidoreductase [Hymenobacter sp. 15J16-1T3B]MCC3156548.1 NAD(P)/FAD-dependent oxidoreductase [Hymenobacter sp. 15J16-1T3B]
MAQRPINTTQPNTSGSPSSFSERGLVPEESREAYDCAIVGGGVAGLTLAIQLAQAGRRVVLFEKETYPFHRVCGEYISMENYAFLERLGVPLAELNLPVMTRFTVSSPSGVALHHPLDIGGVGITHYSFDPLLVGLAARHGATIRQGSKVTDVAFADDEFTVTVAGGATYRARTVCGAWGKHANLDGKLKRPYLAESRQGRQFVAVKYHLQLDYFPEATVEMHNFKDGYCGLSPVPGGLTNCSYISDLRNLRAHGNSIAEMERQVLMRNPLLRPYLQAAQRSDFPPLVISQITFRERSTVDNHVLMLGDAAGTIAPLCGNGMSMGMNAGFLLHPLLLEFLNGRISRAALEEQYTRAWRQLLSVRITAGRLIHQVFGQPQLTTAGIQVLRRLPFLTDFILKQTHGQAY